MTEDTQDPAIEDDKAEGEALPGGWQSDADILTMVKTCRKESDKHLADWLKEAKECYDLAAGHQWSGEDKAVLDEQGRPVVVFNRISPVLDSVAGAEVSNRQQIQFVPRTVGASGVNDLLTGAAQWVRDNCDAEDEESDSFFDLLVCGIGATETRLDYYDDPEGQVLVERVDPPTTRWDPSAKKRNLVDRGWNQRDKWMTAEEIEEKWPDAKLNAATPSGATDDEDKTQPHDATNAWLYKKDATGYDPKSGKYLVIHHQWFTCEPYYRVLDPATNQIVELDEAKMTVAQAAAKASGLQLQSVKLNKKVYRQVFITGGDVLEKSLIPTQKGGFTMKFMTGKRDRNTNTWFGLVRPMTDPQRWANKFFSQMLHIINSNAKGGLLVEDGAIDNIRELEEKWSQADSVIRLNDGAISGEKIMVKPQNAYPVGPEKLMEFSISSIRDSTGVNLELLGMADREQPGVLEAQRKQAGMVILATFFDSLRRYRKENGRLLADFIQNYLSDGRLVRITGKDGTEQFIPLMRQADTIEYDVIVDESPTSHNVKQTVFAMLMQMLPNLLKMGFPIPEDLVDYLPVPSSFAAKWKQQIMQSKQQQAQQPPMPLMIEQAKIQGRMQEKAADVQASMAQHNAEMQVQAANDARDAQREQERMLLDSHLKMVEKKMDMQAEAQRQQMEYMFDRFREVLGAAVKIEVANITSQAKVNDQATKAATKQVSSDI